MQSRWQPWRLSQEYLSLTACHRPSVSRALEKNTITNWSIMFGKREWKTLKKLDKTRNSKESNAIHIVLSVCCTLSKDYTLAFAALSKLDSGDYRCQPTLNDWPSPKGSDHTLAQVTVSTHVES